MCNPRRVQVTATREFAEEWRRAVSRQATVSGRVAGEARLRRPLGHLGAPVLRALQLMLDRGVEGWEETESGYRYDLEGGSVLYDLDAEELEIVAHLEETVTVDGSAELELQGEVSEAVSTEQEGRYYDDGYGGRTEETARREAEQAAERSLDDAVRHRLTEAADEAEAAHDDEVRAAAQADAERRFQEAAARRRAALERAAQARLETLGVRGLRVFNGLLANAFGDAMLAYAQAQGATNISRTDNDGVLEIEFFVDG